MYGMIQMWPIFSCLLLWCVCLLLVATASPSPLLSSNVKILRVKNYQQNPLGLCHLFNPSLPTLLRLYSAILVIATIFNFLHSVALALTLERQSTRMSKIKNGGWDPYDAGPFKQQHFETACIAGVNTMVCWLVIVYKRYSRTDFVLLALCCLSWVVWVNHVVVSIPAHFYQWSGNTGRIWAGCQVLWWRCRGWWWHNNWWGMWLGILSTA